MAGCTALGLICKLITTPLWNLIEDKTINVIDMNEHYLQLVTFLKDCENIMEDFLTGKVRPFPDVAVKEDVMFEALKAESEYDTDCIVILSTLLTCLGEINTENISRPLTRREIRGCIRGNKESCKRNSKAQ